MGEKPADDVVQYWGSPGAAARILHAVRLELPEGAAPADLAGLDHVHSGGLLATKALADAAGIGPGIQVLDVGAGLGGPARWLASQFGCRVTCLDLTPEFCEAAVALTKLTRLTSLVEVVQGDALNTPFDDERFDVVWAQNAFMNISDKAQLFRELHRVLKPGGKLVFQEPMAGPNQPIHYPVTWADRPELSFLASPADCREWVEAVGFQVRRWEDVTTWLTTLPPQPDPHGLSFEIFVSELPLKANNNVRNRKEGRLLQWQAVCARP